MKKLFPYQKAILKMGKTLKEYSELQKYLQDKGIDLSHIYGRGFRLFRWNETDIPNTASFGVCWLNNDHMIELFDNTDAFLATLG